jgi:iron complex transport system substrate-binding protein
MKIVSLLPASTEMVCDLGLRDALAGRSHECDFPAGVESLPVLTSARVDSSRPSGEIDGQVRRILESGEALYRLDEERMRAIAPDVVVTQASCEVCAISYEEVERVSRRAAPHARVVSLQPARLADVLEDVLTVARACDVPERGVSLVRSLEDRLDALRARTWTKRPRVALLEWLDPPMLGAQWVPELLEAAGGEAVGAAPGAMSAYATWEAIEALQLDALVVGPCGFDLARTEREAAPHAERLARVAPRTLLMDGNAYWNRPGPRLIEAAEALAAWLRGEAASAALPA